MSLEATGGGLRSGAGFLRSGVRGSAPGRADVAERVAILLESGVARPLWKAALEATRGLEPSGLWRDLEGEGRLAEVRRRALGKITSRVSPPVRSLALIAEPLDFAGIGGRPAGTEDAGAGTGGGRRERFRLRDKLRAWATTPRVARCGRTQVAPTVDICTRMVDGKSAAYVRGLLTCGSVWACPVCSAKIRAERASEVQHVVAWHGDAMLWTLTVRHARGHALADVRRGVSKAMRLMARGAPWRRWKARVGFVGSVRALEVTHGANGWHPHLHLVLLVRDVGALEREATWLAERWRSCVVAALGAAHAPDIAHGSDIRRCADATYLAKLGLEVTDASGAKSGGGRSPWRIARDAAEGDELADVRLWREFCDAMFGARMLTWSAGLRARAGLGPDVADAELAADQERPGDVEVRLSRRLWRRIGSTAVLLRLLEVAELGGARAARALAAETFARQPRHRAAPARAGPFSRT